MYNIEFDKPIHVHFIGIGGISMSGLAEILLKEHFIISGSDAKCSPLTTKLEKKGAHISYEQVASNITKRINVVVYTAAISKDNPELMEAVSQRIPLLTRAELLGQLMSNYKTPIAVSGTHGKTTTTSMISHVLLQADKDPTISVGGILKSIGGNIRVGNSDIFITEACEYTNSFLKFYPQISILLNIEEDHLDFFKDIEDIRNSFKQFAALLPEDGTLIINAEIDDYANIIKGLQCNICTYGIDIDADISARNAIFNEFGNAAFDLYKKGEYVTHIKLSVTGLHNISNALSAIAIGELLGISLDMIQKGLLSFSGTDRRFEYKGSKNGVIIIDDYAHHPTEIEATLAAAKNYPHREIWCVFQPHTYTRTKVFFKEFAQALTIADHILLVDIYAARETNTLGVSSEQLANEIISLGGDAHYFSSFESIENFILKNCIHGDLLITMGAGDVVTIGEELLKE